jgi:hypothetical protein
VFYGLRDPVVRFSFAVLALVAVAVVLFLALRSGEDRRSFIFHHGARGELLFGRSSSERYPDVGSVDVIGQPTTLRPGFASTDPRVSAAAAREAEKVARSDATLARLVRLGDGRRAVVGRWSFWRFPRGGAVLLYLLRRPVAVNAALPYVQLPVRADSCSTPYAPGWAHLRASGVTVLQVLVDLRRARVVEISTDASRGRVSPVKDKPYPTCSDSGPSG